MTDREQDVLIAKAMGMEFCPPDVDWAFFPDLKPLPEFDSPAGCWLILDYIRDHPEDEDFKGLFESFLDSRIPVDKYTFWEVLPYLTPTLIRDAAYEAATHLVKG